MQLDTEQNRNLRFCGVELLGGSIGTVSKISSALLSIYELRLAKCIHVSLLQPCKATASLYAK
jgi:hypothetical protein